MHLTGAVSQRDAGEETQKRSSKVPFLSQIAISYIHPFPQKLIILLIKGGYSPCIIFDRFPSMSSHDANASPPPLLYLLLFLLFFLFLVLLPLLLLPLSPTSAVGIHALSRLQRAREDCVSISIRSVAWS